MRPTNVRFNEDTLDLFNQYKDLLYRQNKHQITFSSMVRIAVNQFLKSKVKEEEQRSNW